MKPASEEQKFIVEALKTSHVVADCVAGSGKTTTVLHIAAGSDRKILLLTYNARLKLETRERAANIDAPNLAVDTYHSFGVRHISHKCRTDAGLIEYVDSDTLQEFPAYDVVIIDECQDMTPVYYKLARQIVGGAKICLLGDRYQNIYTYAGSDVRFMTLAPVIYGGVWTAAKLSVSYRITHQIANFVNFVLGSPRIAAVRGGKLPRYTIAVDIGNTAAREVIDLIAAGRAPDDIFILAPTVKSRAAKNPLTVFANKLTEAGIPIYIPTSDEKKLNAEVLRGKVTFSSFHQSKGLERDIVIVMGFDQSYFNYYAKNLPRDRCPNTLYVAMTRAREHLSIYHTQYSPAFSFVDCAQLHKYAEVVGKVEKVPASAELPKKNVDVSELSRHIPSIVLARAMELIPHEVIRQPGERLKIPATTAQGGLTEDVSDVNGVAIALAFEHAMTGKCHAISNIYSGFGANSAPSAEEWLQIAVEDMGNRDGLTFRKAQIINYDWLQDDILDAAVARLMDQIGLAAFENPVSRDRGGYHIRGRTDAVVGEQVYEIKVTTSLVPEHYIQIALYAWCMAGKYGGLPAKFLLYNTTTDELVEIFYDEELLTKLVDMLLCKKYHINTELPDNQFLAGIGAKSADHVDAPCAICDLTD